MNIRGLFSNITDSIQIAKVPLCLLVSFSSLFGFSFAADTGVLVGKPSGGAVFAAVLLLSCGGATFNSYQERLEDGLMARTAGRPLVLSRLSQRYALIQASILVVTGLIWLFYLKQAAFVAGVSGIVLYNLVYTKLKSKTYYAIIPGALCGAVPPYIGWLAAGGEYISFVALMPVLLLAFWQIPHFFLVLLNHKRDYLRSISPNILKSLSEEALRRVFLPWITALVTTMLAFSVIPSDLEMLGRSVIVGNAVLLLLVFYVEMIKKGQPNYDFLFKHLNISIFVLMLIFCIE